MVDRMARSYGTGAMSRRATRDLGATDAGRGAARRRRAIGRLEPLTRLARLRWRQLCRSLGLLSPVLRHAHGLAAAGLLLIQLVMSVSTIWIDRAMAERESIVAAEVAQLELDRDRLTIAVAQAGDPAAIEVRARDTLFYVRPEDHLVIIPGAALADEIASPPWWLYE